jgi:iron(III) transport system permease protein
MDVGTPDAKAHRAATFMSSASLRAPFSPLVAILAVLLLAFIVPPTLFLLNASLHTTRPDGSFDQLTLRYYAQLFAGRFFAESLWNTLVYAIGSAVVAVVLGLIQALIVERTNTPGRNYVFLGTVIALGIPHVLYTVGWLLLLGKAGPVNDLLSAVSGGMAAPINVYSSWGMILIEGVSFVPLNFLLMSAVLKAIDTSLEEAAMASGASPWRAFRSVTLPMCLPGVLALLLLLFMRAFESFEVPALVGLAGNITLLTTDIYLSAKGPGAANFGLSGAYSVCLLLAMVLLLVWYNRLSRYGHRFRTITGKGYRARVIDLGPWRWLACGILLALFALVIVLPIGMVIFTSLQPFYEGLTLDSLDRLTLANYRSVLGPGAFRDAIWNTLALGAATATAVVPITALCAWLAARRRPGAWFLDQIATAPLVFPAIVMSVAFLNVFTRLPLPLYGTLVSVVIAAAVRYMPYGMRFTYAGLIQIHPDLEDASAVAGARIGRTFLRVVLPLASAALIGCWLFVFLAASREVSLPLLLVGPGVDIVGPTLFDLWQNGQLTELAAMGMSWVALMTVASTCFHLVTRRNWVVPDG